MVNYHLLIPFKVQTLGFNIKQCVRSEQENRLCYKNLNTDQRLTVSRMLLTQSSIPNMSQMSGSNNMALGLWFGIFVLLMFLRFHVSPWECYDIIFWSMVMIQFLGLVEMKNDFYFNRRS